MESEHGGNVRVRTLNTVCGPRRGSERICGADVVLKQRVSCMSMRVYGEYTAWVHIALSGNGDARISVMIEPRGPIHGTAIVNPMITHDL